MKRCFFMLSILIANMATSQSKMVVNNTSAGLELDALPYITGGYYGSVWMSRNHMRYRAIVTKVTTPEFVLQDGFTNNRIMAYTFIADYFFKPKLKNGG